MEASSPNATGPRVLPAGAAGTIRECVRALRGGAVVAVPTDTVYGLVGLYDNPAAVERIFEIKKRPQGKPLPLLLGSAAELPLVADRVPLPAWALIQHFWPGPLTLILQGKPSLHPRIRSASGGVGCRVPAHGAVLDILEALGLPLASSSANLSGSAATKAAHEVEGQLGTAVDLIVESSDSPSGSESTVVDLTTRPYLIRRRGPLGPAPIRDILGTRVEVLPGA